MTGGRVNQSFSLVFHTQTERVRSVLVVVVVVVVVVVSSFVVVAFVDYDNSAAVVRRRSIEASRQPRRLYTYQSRYLKTLQLSPQHVD